MIYEQISITFNDDVGEKKVIFNQVAFKVEGGFVFVGKKENKLFIEVPIFTIAEARIVSLVIKTEREHE